MVVQPRTVDQVPEFVGNVEASRSIQVRAQVEGVIVERPFVEGRAVNAGDVLFRIDPTGYDADWRGARARLAEAEARLANSERNLERLAPLLSDNAISRQDFDNAESEAKQARASVEDARAAVPEDHVRESGADGPTVAETDVDVTGLETADQGFKARGSGGVCDSDLCLVH